MKITLKKLGNSRGFLIPAAVLDRLGWDEEGSYELDVRETGLTVRRALPSFDEMIRSVRGSVSTTPDRPKDQEI